MSQTKLDLRETAVRAVHDSVCLCQNWGEAAHRVFYEAQADAVLAALGLDDLDAAIERMAQAMYARSFFRLPWCKADPIRRDEFRKDARAALGAMPRQQSERR